MKDSQLDVAVLGEHQQIEELLKERDRLDRALEGAQVSSREGDEPLLMRQRDGLNPSSLHPELALPVLVPEKAGPGRSAVECRIMGAKDAAVSRDWRK